MFAKLFGTILLSSIWQESKETRLVWITMLALSDRKGHVMGSVPGLAAAARVEIEQCRTALKTFMEPDKESSSPEHEGKRIEQLPGGWRILNYEAYRGMRNDDERREYQRVKQAEYRAKKKEQEAKSKEVSGNGEKHEPLPELVEKILKGASDQAARDREQVQEPAMAPAPLPVTPQVPMSSPVADHGSGIPREMKVAARELQHRQEGPIEYHVTQAGIQVVRTGAKNLRPVSPSSLPQPSSASGAVPVPRATPSPSTDGQAGLPPLDTEDYPI